MQLLLLVVLVLPPPPPGRPTLAHYLAGKTIEVVRTCPELGEKEEEEKEAIADAAAVGTA